MIPDETLKDKEDQILERWSQGAFGMLNGIQEDRKKMVAVALEHQRLLNEVLPESGINATFKRISIPMIRRLMAWTDLVSHYRTSAHVQKTSISMRVTLEDRFKRSVTQYSLDEEAERTSRVVDRLKAEVQHFMNLNDKTSIVFLGITLDHDEIIHFYYDWE